MNGNKGGRKNLKRAANEDGLTLQEGQSIMQVLSLRGSNLIEVMDAGGGKSLALFPAKFQKSLWIKHGSFVVVDESGREKALESGSKVACMVSQVLFHAQVRVLQKSPEWPEIFKTIIADDSNSCSQRPKLQLEEEGNSSDDDGLPPLEANTNRIRPPEFHSGSESDSDS
ncbi:nucleic acid-binding, OB-fold-like protein [Tasmannia lanceolata]|uniref:nucleic acid-binding, OB-fold-like protein n=1 Tax=Tasmannia lanceolata TaxID=3420 RepID=UPI0040628567